MQGEQQRKNAGGFTEETSGDGAALWIGLTVRFGLTDLGWAGGRENEEEKRKMVPGEAKRRAMG